MNVAMEVLRIAGFGLVHGAWIAAECPEVKVLCPIVIIDGESGRRVIPFEAATQLDAIVEAKETVKELMKTESNYCFLRENLDREAGPLDLFTVDVWVAGMLEPITVTQYFRRPSPDGPFRLLGKPRLFIGSDIKELFDGPDVQTLIEEGMCRHPVVGTRWREWRAPA